MTKFSIALTGFEETRSFTRIDPIENALSGKSSDFKPLGPVSRFLVFNDGDIKIPCDPETYKKISAYWNKALASAPKKPLEDSLPEEADVFGGDIPPVPEEQEWSGAEDEGEDGVGQL